MVLNPYLYDDSEVDLGPEPDLDAPPEPPPPPLPLWLVQSVPVVEHLQGRHNQKDHGKGGPGAKPAAAEMGAAGLEAGGFSVRFFGGGARAPKDGIMVSYGNKHGHNTTVPKVENMSRAERKQAIVDHMDRNSEFIHARSDRFAGGWLDTSPSGSVTMYLDVSRRFNPDQLAAATRAGQRENQLGIFNVGTGEFISTGGTGE